MAATTAGFSNRRHADLVDSMLGYRVPVGGPRRFDVAHCSARAAAGLEAGVMHGRRTNHRRTSPTLGIHSLFPKLRKPGRNSASTKSARRRLENPTSALPIPLHAPTRNREIIPPPPPESPLPDHPTRFRLGHLTGRASPGIIHRNVGRRQPSMSGLFRRRPVDHAERIGNNLVGVHRK